MGQKVNPIGLRLGVNRSWDSVWFDEKNFASRVNEDILIRHYLNRRYAKSSICTIQIDRKPSKTTITVSTSRPGLIIGKGGSTIKDIIEKSGAKIDISDNGSVKIAGTNNESIEAAKELINSIIEEPEVGQVYEGKVVKIMEFGAFVNFFGKRDGLVHISQLSKERVEKVTDVVNEGDIVKVKVLGFDKGKVKLSIKDTEE